MANVKIGSEFKPSLQLKKLYFAYLISSFVLFFIIFCAPLLLFAPVEVAIILGFFLILPIMIIFLFAAWWIPKFYNTMLYKLTDSEIVWRRGVWFKETGIVPYNRITNIDIKQGPVSRKLRIASLKIQTAGYSGQAARPSEIRIDGMENFEDVREVIMSFVRGRKPVAVETYDETKGEASMLGELVKIRKLLEKRKK
jgi:membrane protein YdbS with pleckstrin-like domain